MILAKDVNRISRDYIAEIKFIEQIKNVKFRTKANFYDEPDEDELFPSKSFWANKKRADCVLINLPLQGQNFLK